MRESPNIALLGEVMEKYRLAEPVQTDVQRHIGIIKRAQFQKILKRTAGYSLFFALVSNIFFTLKKYGLGITIVKSAILLGIVTLVTAAAVTTGIYFLVARDIPPEKQLNVLEIMTDAVSVGPSEDPQEPPAIIEDRVGIQPFTGIDFPAAGAARFSDRMARSLAALRGPDRVVNLRLGRGGRKSGMMLFGAVESAGGAHTVTVRVASVKDSRILFYDSETVQSEAELESACDRLAKKVYEKIR